MTEELVTQEQAQRQAEMNDQITSLARVINTEVETGAHISKGVITATQIGGTPPTVSVQLDGDTSVSVSDVRFMDHVTPVVGDTVFMIRQKDGLMIFGQCATAQSHAMNGWVTPTLASGWSVYSADPLMYRVVLDNGSKKVQWRGRATVSSGTPSLITTVDAIARPLFQLAPILVARGFGGGSNVAQIDVLGNGNINLVGATVGIKSTDTATHNSGTANTGAMNGTVTATSFSSGYGLVNGEEGTGQPFNGDTGSAHRHGMAHGHFVGGHTHVQTVHFHGIDPATPVDFPDFVSFNGVEYFI